MIQYAKPKIKSPVAVAAAGRAGIEPGSYKSASQNGVNETHRIPTVNSVQQGMAEGTCDKFFDRLEIMGLLDYLRDPLTQSVAQKYERALIESPYRGEQRMALACYAQAEIRETFVATIGGRGFIRKLRTVLLTNLRLFGSRFIQEDHVWVPYSKLWEQTEPFYQGEKVVLVGTAVQYMRKNGTNDYSLTPEYVTKLWPPGFRQSTLTERAALTTGSEVAA